MTIKFTWQEEYTEALLQTSLQEFPPRIAAAEKAIYQRIGELKYANFSSTEERCAIDDALRGLRVSARSASQPQSSPKASEPPKGVAG